MLQHHLGCYCCWSKFFYSSGESEITRQLSDMNSRYEDLKIRLRDRQEDINLWRLFLDRLVFVNGRLDWCIEAENKMQRLKPVSRELEPLKKEFELYKVRFTVLCNAL